MHLGADFIKIGAKVDVWCSAFITILDLRRRKMMQHHLHHAEFIQVGIEQRSNDHQNINRVGPAQYGVRKV